MASPRRPTYTSTGRGRPGPGGRQDGSVPGRSGQGASGQRGPAQGGPGHRPTAPHNEPVVISASKSVPDSEPAEATGSKKGKVREPSPGGNVLAFPEPRGRRLKRNALIAACVTTALVAGVLAAAIFSPLLAVGTISVSGTRLLTAEQVQSALEPLRGKPLPQISDEEVTRLLEPLVQVKSVSTEARPPSELVVKVFERAPVALVKQGEQYQLVDVDGVQLATTADPESVSLPVIDGGAGAIGKDLFQATAAVLGALPPDVLAKLSNASAQSVDAVELKLVDGQTIVWGNAGERELKAKVLEALLKAPADPKNPVRVYDVSVPRHPVTR